jgi:hypothetical protein
MGSRDSDADRERDEAIVEAAGVADVAGAGAAEVVPVPVHPAAKTEMIQKTIRIRGPASFTLRRQQTDCIFIPGSAPPW